MDFKDLLAKYSHIDYVKIVYKFQSNYDIIRQCDFRTDYYKHYHITCYIRNRKIRQEKLVLYHKLVLYRGLKYILVDKFYLVNGKIGLKLLSMSNLKRVTVLESYIRYLN